MITTSVAIRTVRGCTGGSDSSTGGRGIAVGTGAASPHLATPWPVIDH